MKYTVYMESILPIIRISALQRRPKDMLDKITDYAVVQSHGHDRAFILHPRLGRILLESGMLEVLKQKCKEQDATQKMHPQGKDQNIAGELTDLIGTVLRELSKK